MEIEQVFELEEHRAGVLFNYFSKVHDKLIPDEHGSDEIEIEFLDLGDPHDDSVRAYLGNIQDTKYSICLDWCRITTLTCGIVERFTAKIDHENDRTINRIIVEKSAAGYGGIFYSMRMTLEPSFNPDEIISHLIMRDISEYPSMRCCGH